MKCPFCGTNNNFVVDTRWSEAKECQRRRYRCRPPCNKRFSTHERMNTLTRLELLKHLGHNLTPKEIRNIKKHG